MIDRKEEVVADLLPRRVEINGNGRIFGVESGDYPREEANWFNEPVDLVLGWDRDDIRS